jgi:XTP/dITP diphosphohydrolase
MTVSATMNEIVIASRNQHKISEIKALLADLPIRVVAANELTGMPEEIVEDGTTFLENAMIKARAIAIAANAFALADDSGLEVPALGGEPGVDSRWSAGKGSTDADNTAKLLERMAEIPDKDRRGRFRCVVALASPQGEVLVHTEGSCDGRIIREPRGTGGFGYDPLFLVPGQGKTFGELGETTKNRISHRAEAIRAMRHAIDDLIAGRR